MRCGRLDPPLSAVQLNELGSVYLRENEVRLRHLFAVVRRVVVSVRHELAVLVVLELDTVGSALKVVERRVTVLPTLVRLRPNQLPAGGEQRGSKRFERCKQWSPMRMLEQFIAQRD